MTVAGANGRAGGGAVTLAGAARAFAQRDWRIVRAARSTLLFEALAAVFTVLTFTLVARVVEPGAVRGGYLTFAVTGVAMTAFLQAGVATPVLAIRAERSQGTFDLLVASGVRTRELAAGMSAYPLASAIVRAAVYVGLAAAVGARAPDAHWPLAFAAALLGAVAFSGLGLIAIGLAIAFRHAAASVGWLVTLVALAGGSVAPVAVFPAWLRALGRISPFTIAVEVLRDALAGEAGPAQVARLGVLCAAAIVCVGAGVAAIDAALRHAKRAGTLGLY